MFKLLDFNGNSHVGVFARTNGSVTFIQRFLTERVYGEVAEALGTKLMQLTIGGGNLVGSMLAANSHGAVISSMADDDEIALLEGAGLKVVRLHDRINAAGNNILCNDHAALAHPEIKEKHLLKIEETLGVPVRLGSIAGVNTVGTAGVVTNKGLLCHAKTTDEELEKFSAFFNVEAKIGTVNHGIPFVGAGVVANEKGAVIGTKTTGIELGRIEEALKLY
ncbi:MAG: translation initiation factor IF-6 [Thermoplasmata archaeon HGW-Thermoplasmata-1]|nr:MAG: translation initiation factor IF-6 [Thermoplasmata archaeon HGW-Thermoplasmata-1]